MGGVQEGLRGKWAEGCDGRQLTGAQKRRRRRQRNRSRRRRRRTLKGEDLMASNVQRHVEPELSTPTEGRQPASTRPQDGDTTLPASHLTHCGWLRSGASQHGNMALVDDDEAVRWTEAGTPSPSCSSLWRLFGSTSIKVSISSTIHTYTKSHKYSKVLRLQYFWCGQSTASLTVCIIGWTAASFNKPLEKKVNEVQYLSFVCTGYCSSLANSGGGGEVKP